MTSIRALIVDDHPVTREGLRTALELSDDIVVVVGEAASGEEAVEQALCFGWIDSTNRSLDDERSMMWFAPRRRGSGWARSNKQRIERLEASGQMAPPGRALIDGAKADGSWTMLDDVEDLVVPPDLAEAFDAHPGSREQWDAFPRSARRGILEWVAQAKRAPTRAAASTLTTPFPCGTAPTATWSPTSTPKARSTPAHAATSVRSHAKVCPVPSRCTATSSARPRTTWMSRAL